MKENDMFTAKIKSFFAAIAWAFVAIVCPDAAGAEMAKQLTTEDPNQTGPTYLEGYPYTIGPSIVECATIAKATGMTAAELVVIRRAAIRNKCLDDNYLILLAIRKAESGRPGLEFGIMHWRCLLLCRKNPYKTLDIQAGWAAATIVKTRVRWKIAGKPPSFIRFLADRYCPASVDPAGNEYWKINVTYWTAKLRGAIKKGER